MVLVDPYKLPDIDFVGGSTQEFAFHCYHYKGKRPLDMSFSTAEFAIIDYVNKNGAPLVVKQMDVLEGTAKDGLEYNVLAVKLDAADTVKLAGKFIYQISIKDRDGAVEIPSQGIIQITNNIDKPFVRLV